jgi:hypothetical protein
MLAHADPFYMFIITYLKKNMQVLKLFAEFHLSERMHPISMAGGIGKEV